MIVFGVSIVSVGRFVRFVSVVIFFSLVSQVRHALDLPSIYALFPYMQSFYKVFTPKRARYRGDLAEVTRCEPACTLGENNFRGKLSISAVQKPPI